MMQTGKAYRKSIPAAWLQPVGDGSGKWRPEGIAPQPISKQQVLRYFNFIEALGRLLPAIETQVSHDALPIGIALLGQVQGDENGNENEGVQPAADEAPSDGIPPDDSLFRSDLLRNQDKQVVGGENGESGERSGGGSVRSQGFQALRVLEFKKGSTQLPADPEDVKAGKFDTALRDEWLLNICRQEVFRNFKEVKKEEAKAKRLTVINLGARFTWKEKEQRKMEKRKRN
uniref:Uncharacterized protein n=1 Tax=Chromera velia CCMP2878 TaxID=1169474 RepID=A0A0G4F6Z9_9ALVE|eukprot:Cvel_15396.t1-p1 / transcript=Cvel_15396.t1 / gene=Cvel_15396 / organism=Chromera_velia_CCMP2878 / gene_product=hypothetical protein / transcript_product=hypothetical protein / location=Cvel_scaffold1137:2851-3537(-) / protein_length=229 / sequence_SO=supercontig / SO=protein_coding / is_pseudo=false